jgi:hypothetical protein
MAAPAAQAPLKGCERLAQINEALRLEEGTGPSATVTELRTGRIIIIMYEMARGHRSQSKVTP